MKPSASIFSKQRSLQHRGNKGFALIIAVSLLAFLVLLIVGLAALTKIETKISDNSSKQLQARANALMALNIALGQLQQHAGPDQRVTATAQAFGGIDGTRYYTGVWDATASGTQPLIWLASGSENGLITPSQVPVDSVTLVGVATAGLGGEVVASKVPISADRISGYSGATAIGHYAWWVGDEGVKSDIGIADNTDELNYPPYVVSGSPTESHKRLKQLMGLGGPAIDAEGDKAYDAHLPDSARALIGQGQIALLPALTTAVSAENYHTWSVGNTGVLADTEAGGLRRDLSLDGELPPGEHMLGDAFANWANYSNSSYMEDYSTPAASSPIPEYGDDPVRRRYYMRPATNGGGDGVAPVLTYFYITLGVRKQNAASPYQIGLRWAVALWNPYANALVPEDLYIEVSGLPQQFRINSRPSTAPEGSASPDVTFSLRDRFGEPLKIDLPWDSSPAESDLRSWLPGRTYNWVSTADAAFTSVKTNVGRFYSRSIPALTSGLMTTIDSATGANGNSRLTLTIGDESTLTVRLFRKNAGSPVLLATYTSPTFEAVETTAEFVANGNTSPLGFIFRLAESHDSIALNPSLWLTEGAYDIRDAEIGSIALVSPPNGPVPSQYWNYFTISSPERLFDRDVTNGKSFNEDIPVFELPRFPLLSIGSLQHLHIPSAQSFSIGNPWGRDVRINGIELNALFDRFYFSGLTSDVQALGAVMPNSLLSNYAGTSLAVIATSDEQASSRYLMQRGAFNVNSVSVAAWSSLLRSTRFLTGGDFQYLNHDPETGTAADTAMVPHDPASAAFFRFPQSAQETFEADSDYRQTTTNAGGLGGPIINSALFRRGLRVLSEDEVNNLAREIAAFVRVRLQRSGPFRSMREFLNRPDVAVAYYGVNASGEPYEGQPRSLLEGAIAAADLNSASVLGLGDTDPEFSSQWLTQGDIMTSLAPVTFARSDTFVVRIYGDVTNPVTSEVEAKAWCEVRVQRTPEPVNANPLEFRMATGEFGRQFIVTSFRWLNESEL